MKKHFERAQKLRKEVKDDTAKYEVTITQLKRKGQMRQFKQISYWFTLILKLNTLNKTATQNKNDSEEQYPCSGNHILV